MKKLLNLLYRLFYNRQTALIECFLNVMTYVIDYRCQLWNLLSQKKGRIMSEIWQWCRVNQCQYDEPLMLGFRWSAWSEWRCKASCRELQLVTNLPTIKQCVRFPLFHFFNLRFQEPLRFNICPHFNSHYEYVTYMICKKIIEITFCMKKEGFF